MKVEINSRYFMSVYWGPNYGCVSNGESYGRAYSRTDQEKFAEDSL